MRLNSIGKVAHEEWWRSEKLRSEIRLDAFVVMPNHVHGIVFLNGRRGTARRAPTAERFGKPTAQSLPTFIRAYKSAVTKRINELRISSGAPVWQRNYYEHIIRGKEELDRIREYVAANPLRWPFDPENPAASTDPDGEFPWEP